MALQAEVGAVFAAVASIGLDNKVGSASALKLASSSDLAAAGGAFVAEHASQITVAQNDQTALGRSMAVWAAQAAANAAQAAANAAAYAVFVEPDDPFVKLTAQNAQRAADEAARYAAVSALALKQ